MNKTRNVRQEKNLNKWSHFSSLCLSMVMANFLFWDGHRLTPQHFNAPNILMLMMMMLQIPIWGSNTKHYYIATERLFFRYLSCYVIFFLNNTTTATTNRNSTEERYDDKKAKKKDIHEKIKWKENRNFSAITT